MAHGAFECSERRRSTSQAVNQRTRSRVGRETRFRAVCLPLQDGNLPLLIGGAESKLMDSEKVRLNVTGGTAVPRKCIINGVLLQVPFPTACAHAHSLDSLLYGQYRRGSSG